MKTKKEEKNIAKLNTELSNSVNQFINNPNIRKLDEHEKLTTFLNLIIKAYSSQTRLNTAFIDDLIFIIEDFINSFNHQTTLLLT